MLWLVIDDVLCKVQACPSDTRGKPFCIISEYMEWCLRPDFTSFTACLGYVTSGSEKISWETLLHCSWDSQGLSQKRNLFLGSQDTFPWSMGPRKLLLCVSCSLTILFTPCHQKCIFILLSLVPCQIPAYPVWRWFIQTALIRGKIGEKIKPLS